MNKKTVTPKDALISLVCIQKSCEHLGIYPVIKEHLIKISDFVGGEYVEDIEASIIHLDHPKRTPIQQETIDILHHASLTSPRARYALEAMKNAKSSFEIIRILASALITSEQEAEIYKNHYTRLREISPIPDMFLDETKYTFMGADVAEAGKDVGVYRDIQTQSDTKI